MLERNPKKQKPSAEPSIGGGTVAIHHDRAEGKEKSRKTLEKELKLSLYIQYVDICMYVCTHNMGSIYREGRTVLCDKTRFNAVLVY